MSLTKTPALQVAGKSLFITGIDGFVGRHLRSIAEAAGFLVSGSARRRHAPEERIYQCEISDEDLLERYVNKCAPDYVIHLAGLSHFVDGNVAAFFQTNLVGSRSLLSALSRSERRPRRVLLVSSGNVYGVSSVDKLAESLPLRPISDYSVSKVAMEHLVHWWSQFFEITVARPFNHIGMGQSSSFLVPKLVHGFKKRVKSLELGGMTTIRDYSDVRDIARVYLALLLHPEVPPHPVNVCSGFGRSVMELVGHLEQITGHSIKMELNHQLVRTYEIPRLVGDPTFLENMGIASPSSNITPCLEWMLSA